MTKFNKETAKDKFNDLAAKIEELFGTGKWQMPFGVAKPHRNAVTGKRYNGMNSLILAVIAQERGYTSREWATYKQLQTNDWVVRKGEKASPVEFWSTFKDKEDQDKDVWYAKYYSVFNLDQVVDADGNPVVSNEIAELPDLAEQQAIIYELASKMNVKIVHVPESGEAYYIRSKHEIHLPAPQDFHTQELYINTALHELSHATHRYVRSDWEKGPFGSVLYAKEEVVAELTAVLASSMFGVEKIPLESHSAYISGWLSLTKEDSKTFFRTAIKEATKASLFMWDTLYPEDSESKSIVNSDIAEKISV